MDLRASAAVCKRSPKPPQSGELDMHELRSGPTKVKGLRRRGRTDTRIKGFRALPSFRAYENKYCWPGLAGLAGLAGLLHCLLAWLAWPGKAGWRREEAGRRYMEEEEG